jgi:hypothetical protein
MRRVGLAACVLLLARVCQAASPVLNTVLPRGGQRGTQLELTLHGERLADAQQIVFCEPGLNVLEVSAADPQTVKAKIEISGDAPLGEHLLRLRTASGLSEVRTFHVTAFPTTQEAHAEPQRIPLNCTVAGVTKSEDSDLYTFTASAGTRIGIEVLGMRLGGPFYDPQIVVRGPGGATVAASDDTPLLRQDPFVTLVTPQDGEYTIDISDAQHGGSDDSQYLMQVGTFPRPTAVFPPGGQVGRQITARFIGDPAGPIEQAITLPAEPSEAFAVYAQKDGQTSPSPNLVRVSAFPDVNESEPNNELAQANPLAGEAPQAFNGIIDPPGDADWLSFAARKDQAFDVHVAARRLRSPLDPVLNVHRVPDGGHVGGNDDADNHPDSYLRVTAPADGVLAVKVNDQRGRGGADFVYRVEVTPVQPSLALTLPEFAQNSQERHAIVVPRGGRWATLIRAVRGEIGGELQVSASDLPAGVTAQFSPVADGTDLCLGLFEAVADAPLAASSASLLVRPADQAATVTGRYTQAIPLVNSGQERVYQAQVDRLAVAVTEPAPFTLSVDPPTTPIVRDGIVSLRIVATRREGFDKPIRIHMPYKPNGLGAGDVSIESGQTEVQMPLNAAGNASVGTWMLCVMAFSDTDTGRIWTASPMITLNIAEPYVRGRIEMAAAEQGQTAPLVCQLEHPERFDGKAKAELLGLPPNTTAQPVEITADDAQAVFQVAVTPQSPPGQHRSLFVRLSVPKDGGQIVHQFAYGGTLRIDPPSAGVAQAPPPATDKPLTRLEQLRRQAVQAQ